MLKKEKGQSPIPIFLSLALLILVHNINFAESARILFMTALPSISHNLFYHRIIKELSLRGHKIISITADPMNNPNLSNLTEIDVHQTAYNSFNVEGYLEKQQTAKKDPVSMMRLYLPSYLNITDRILANSKVKAIINNPSEHFDLFIVEMIWASANYGFKERFNCPFIGVISVDIMLNVMDAIGNPSNPSYMVDFSKPAGTSFWRRLDNFLYAIQYRWFHNWELIPAQNEILIKHFDSKIKDVAKLEKSVDVILTNMNPIFLPTRPLTPNVIPIGGLHMRERHPLPQDLQMFLDSSKDGVIYFSLGSNVKSKNLPTEVRAIILNTFSKLPYKVLWKWEEDNLSIPAKNIMTRKWLPQQDVLDHPNVKLFITQGGIQSIDEALRSQVPMIGIPFGGDQEFNTQRFVALGIGKQLFIEEITEDKLKKAIVEIITNPEYKKRIAKVSTLIWDQETKPLDRAIWWIEYVLRHGGAQHLRSLGADLPWYKYLLLDVIAFLIVCLLFAFYIIIAVVKIVLKIVFKSKYKTD